MKQNDKKTSFLAAKKALLINFTGSSYHWGCYGTSIEIYHSLIEIYDYHNYGLQSKIKHRHFVFNKILHFKHLFSNTSILKYSVTQDSIQFYSQFSNNMFNVVGI